MVRRKTNPKTKTEPENDDENDPKIIDATELAPEDLPADLWEKVERYRDHLVEVRLQSKRSGRWKLLRPRLGFDPPPEVSSEAICHRVVEWARQDAEQSHGEAERYRARLGIQIPDKPKLDYRFANLRTSIDSDGSIAVSDDMASGSDKDIVMQMVEARKQEHDFMFRALDSVNKTLESQTKQAEGYAAISKAFNKMLLGVAEIAARSNSGEVERLRILLEQQSNEHEHEADMARMAHLARVLEKPVEKIGDQFAAYLRHRMTGGAPPPPTNGGSRLAAKLERVFAEMSAEQIERTMAAFSDNERDCIEQARKAKDDQTFAALFDRFFQELKKRGPNGADELMGTLQNTMPTSSFVTLFELMQEAERHKAA